MKSTPEKMMKIISYHENRKSYFRYSW